MADEIKKNTIELTCPQLGTTDYFTFDEITTFNDIVTDLIEKYESEVLLYIQENFQNIRRGLSLNEVTVKLHFIDRQGIRQTVGLYTKISELRKKQKLKKLYWEAEPIGGL